MRVADYIAQTVESLGSDCCFMVAGGMMMHLMDAFGRLPRMPYYCHHHEQAAAMAADAYARQSGKLGVCLATSGPGATNLLTGLVGAYQDSSPVLFLTGQCKRAETVRASGIPGLRQAGFLEVDIVPIVESVTKYAAFIESPERARYHLEKALHLALAGRPGPVLLDVPLDVQGAVFPEDSPGFVPDTSAPSAIPNVADIDRLLARLAGARRPVMLAGHGVRCAGRTAQFRSIIERLQVPVATTFMAKDLLPYAHPLFAGHPGPRGERGANFVIQAADAIVFLGCSMHIQTVGYENDLFAPEAYKIEIEVDPAVRKRERIGAREQYGWDIKDFLDALESRMPESPIPSPEWARVAHSLKNRYAVIDEPHEMGGPTDVVNLYEFVHLLSESLQGDETIMTDAGQPHPVMAQAFRLKGSQRYLNPGSLAEMGWALPASFGAAAAAPGRQIVAVIGDGSLQTNIQELQTLVHHGFNVKLFVINNDGYASIRNTQRSFFDGFYVGSTPGSGVTLPDTAKIANAYGIEYIRCQNRSALSGTLRHVLDTPTGPVLCEVMAQQNQRVLPAVPSALQPDGQIRSKALHEMLPDIGIAFGHIVAELP